MTKCKKKKKFEVIHTGLYKTRNGKKVFISVVRDDACIGLVEAEEESRLWDRRGLYLYWEDEECPVDIIEEWEG